MPTWSNITNNYTTYLKISEIFKLRNLTFFVSYLIMLLGGWVSIFLGFFFSNAQGSYIIKLHYYNVIVKVFLNKMPLQLSSLLFGILRMRKIILWSNVFKVKTKK